MSFYTVICYKVLGFLGGCIGLDFLKLDQLSCHRVDVAYESGRHRFNLCANLIVIYLTSLLQVRYMLLIHFHPIGHFDSIVKFSCLTWNKVDVLLKIYLRLFPIFLNYRYLIHFFSFKGVFFSQFKAFILLWFLVHTCKIIVFIRVIVELLIRASHF